MDLHSQSMDNLVSLSEHNTLFVKSHHLIFSDLNPDCHRNDDLHEFSLLLLSILSVAWSLGTT